MYKISTKYGIFSLINPCLPSGIQNQGKLEDKKYRWPQQNQNPWPDDGGV
jgi:hypothetical protein